MPAKNLRIDQLELDLLNPRISKATDQRNAMEKIIAEQGVKILNLAESIALNGLNPMDRYLVIESDRRGKYVILEGNRRIVALKLLKNATLANDIEMKEALKKRLRKARENFDVSTIEPLACFIVPDRAQGNSWILQRHTGEDEGRGIVDWSGIAAGRFRGRAPELQALDFVRQHANLTDAQKDLLDGKFPITNLERLLSTPDVRERLGFEIVEGKLKTALPPEEALKPLRRIVLDIAEKKIRVTKIKSKAEQLQYLNEIPGDMPNLAKKSGDARPLETISEGDFSSALKAAKKQPKQRNSPRTTVVPKTCKLSIGNPKIGEIYTELKLLQLSKHPHAIAVLMRVFLECSVDEYLTRNTISLLVPTAGGDRDKALRQKVQDTVDSMVAAGADKRDFKGVTTALGNNNHPFSPELLNAYVHNRFFSPTERDLTTAWDNGQPLFERIWS